MVHEYDVEMMDATVEAFAVKFVVGQDGDNKTQAERANTLFYGVELVRMSQENRTPRLVFNPSNQVANLTTVTASEQA